MAPRRLSLPIILAALLLFSQVFARDLEEKPAADKKGAGPNVDDAKYIPDGYYRHFPYHRPCRYHCSYRCCSEEEFTLFSQTQMSEFNDDKQMYGGGGGVYGGGPGYGYGRGCYYLCGYSCCSAEEYAKFVQAGN